MKKIKQSAILNGLGIIGIIGGTTTLVGLDILNVGAFILAAMACFPMAKNLWGTMVCLYVNPLRILNKVLPKIDFSIDKADWNEDRTHVFFHGTYQGNGFNIEADLACLYVMIYDDPWWGVMNNNTDMPRTLEAINEVNAVEPNMSVILCEPNDGGLRLVYTFCQTILPLYKPKLYIESLLCEILNRRAALSKALKKERPYMAQRRGPIGFNAPRPANEASAEEQSAPAAKNDSGIKN